MSLRTFSNLFIMITLFPFSGCVDRVVFDTQREAGQLVVSGGIIDRPGPYTLQIGRTTNERGLPEPATSAKVTLVDGDGNKEGYVETEAGTYILSGEHMQGERGQRYHIEFELPNGKLYKSIPERIPEIVGKDSAWFEIGTIEEQSASGEILEKPAIHAFVDTRIPPHDEPLFLRWTVENSYAFKERASGNPLSPAPSTCYVTFYPNPQKISLSSTSGSDTSFISGQLVATKQVLMHEFYIRHYFNVIIFSISERRYQYWQHVDDVINQTGTIFDVPPATVPGNLFNVNDENELVLGYFEAAAVDTSRFFVTRGDFPFFIPSPCGSHPACNNCLSIENSSAERPYYFGQ